VWYTYTCVVHLYMCGTPIHVWYTYTCVVHLYKCSTYTCVVPIQVWHLHMCGKVLVNTHTRVVKY